MAFVHLHNHTEYSMLDGATKIKAMVRRAADLGMPAVAITDHGVMCGVPELCDAVEAVKKETGVYVKPIYGCEVYFTEDREIGTRKKSPLYHLILLAKNNVGYHNLLHIVSESHMDNFFYKPRTTIDVLEKYSEGIIGTTACMSGIVQRRLDDRNYADALAWTKRFADIFAPGDFYVELQDQGLTSRGGLTQKEINTQLTQIAQELGLKTIATNDFHYLTREDAAAQDIMLCIGTGSLRDDENRMRFSNDEFYMKTEEEMREALKDFPEACDNTIEVAEKCFVELERDSVLPRFPLPPGYTEEQLFREECEKGLERRYGPDWREIKISDGMHDVSVLERYEYEASVIVQQGFPAYFLIVQEYIRWAKEHGIGVGPGRGSAAGAICTYAMGITDLEPLSNGLLFERFLSPERVEMPDIDVDFEDERRQEVIDHVREFYGADHIAGVITFGKLQAKNAVRDAARVLGHPYNTGDRLCKVIGDELGIKLKDAIENNPDLAKIYKEEPESREILDSAMSIEGNIRGEGVHACATIICRDPLVDHVPVKRDTKGGGMITQYDGHYTPELGLLKMDFLGLRTLGVLSRACRNVKDRFGITIVPDEIPIDDEGAYKLMRLETPYSMDGLFQVESALYVSLFARMKPRTFSDIVASIALNRPGPLENGFVDLYVDRRMGRKPVSYYDDRLKPLLEETYGTIVYQEQIMQISMAMSGFSAGKADKLRKAMGKKRIEVMMQLKDDWCNGAVENGFSLEIAERIWHDAEEFAKYAFNKSHSAAYAVLVCRTAYMKAHYPYEYMAAVLSSYMGSADKLIKYISSCTRNGIPVLPPDINSSNLEFTPLEEGIRFGLAGVRGVGAAVAESIIAERDEGGPFTSLHDFVNRVDGKCYNRKTLEALVKAGAFDSTGYTRKQLMYFIDETSLLEDVAKRQRDRENGQVSMFDLFGDMEDSGFEEDIPAPDGVEWDKRTLLAFEKSILKIYVSDHPLSQYERSLRSISKFQLGDLADHKGDIKNGVFCGLISTVQIKMTKKGKKMATFVMEDTTGFVDCVCFKYDEFKDAIEEDAIVKVKGKFEHSERGDQLMAFEVERLDVDSMKQGPSSLQIMLQSSDLNSMTSAQLNNVLANYPGRDPVVLLVQQSDGRKFRAELPVTVDAANNLMYSEIMSVFGRPVWQTA
ncbi:DNA polymerase III subunit alpha [Slackia heliotrinireducens]|uniref:DNA polymerase III subunit alpha n=1 Tax=Slackia heliotrinireducens (strain ATCC 29202 / DSM 20476 / NCTC 11029 / RHS 1) TaxID=471855 RepID=C7N8B2_SLAHD|nr:DNA polymerase III subunit alpha [Slackia heliotrinireducens]ACV23147.1 DNA-directed DNA polymerase III PolC [Slackia heliotrinireducens DSM 20476]VEH02190.1 DNA polymerase III subunit alpha [Slackia heliotrinireducens]